MGRSIAPTGVWEETDLKQSSPAMGFLPPLSIWAMDSGGQSRATWDLEPLL